MVVTEVSPALLPDLPEVAAVVREPHREVGGAALGPIL
jgi:hypothetical protein